MSIYVDISTYAPDLKMSSQEHMLILNKKNPSCLIESCFGVECFSFLDFAVVLRQTTFLSIVLIEKKFHSCVREEDHCYEVRFAILRI